VGNSFQTKISTSAASGCAPDPGRQLRMKGNMNYMQVVKAVLETRSDLTEGQKETFDISRARYLGEIAHAAMLEATSEEDATPDSIRAAMKLAIFNSLNDIPANASAQRQAYKNWLAGPKATTGGQAPSGL
jgi:hypothetical protein